MVLPVYDVSVDELRVALSWCIPNLELKQIQITKKKSPAGIVQSSATSSTSPATKTAASKKTKATPPPSDADDFDVFGDDDGEDEDAVASGTVKEDETATMAAAVAVSPKESRTEMLARLKAEAEARAASKELKQRTLVAIEVKPWDVEQDLMVLWKKITTTITQNGLKWGENCTLADVAFGIKKIQTTFVMGVNNSSDDVVDAILAMEDEVQSCEVMSMSVL